MHRKSAVCDPRGPARRGRPVRVGRRTGRDATWLERGRPERNPTRRVTSRAGQAATLREIHGCTSSYPNT